MHGRLQERSRYSIDVTQPDTLTQRIKEKERQKMAQCEQVKKKKEYEELKECTFTPAIKRAVPKQASGPIVVRGLGRHLELKELAQRQSEEKAERERKVFLTHVTNASTKPYTVPHPFDLSSYDKKHEVSSHLRLLPPNLNPQPSTLKHLDYTPRRVSRIHLSRTYFHDTCLPDPRTYMYIRVSTTLVPFWRLQLLRSRACTHAHTHTAMR